MSLIRGYLTGMQELIDRLPIEAIDRAVDLLHDARRTGKQVFILGNGGSASTAAHFVCDLAKNTRQAGRPALRVIGLADNMAIFSAYANDEGYASVFASQLANLLNPGDVVIAISASGKSANVLAAVEFAAGAGAQTVAFTGFDGGKLGQIAALNIHVPSERIEHVEDVHLMLEHIICSALRARLMSDEAEKI